MHSFGVNAEIQGGEIWPHETRNMPLSYGILNRLRVTLKCDRQIDILCRASLRCVAKNLAVLSEILDVRTFQQVNKN